MQERPMQDLLDGLNGIGVQAASVEGTGCPPVEVRGGRVSGGRVKLDCGVSSQFLSALLLIGPYAEKGMEIDITRGPVSRPYIDITLGVMADFGISVEREGYRWFHVPGGQTYRSRAYRIEPDASQAGYFWAAAAVTGTAVTVAGIDVDSRQGDVRFVEVLSAMGCRVERKPDGIRVTGGDLRAVEVDMGTMPDLVPTLAVTAAFARGTTRIRNVAHLRAKESDRLSVTAAELQKMGIAVECMESGIDITGGPCHGAEIDPHDDHRIAMSFAVAGLVTPGVRIRQERCVEKSFPDFWKILGALAEQDLVRGPFPD
jgi:3-phosphoshikimate 1-carboxyvinyltransferase